jgi:hypothetical protein
MRIVASVLRLRHQSPQTTTHADDPPVKVDVDSKQFQAAFSKSFAKFADTLKENVGTAEFENLMNQMDTKPSDFAGAGAGFQPPSESDMQKMANPAKFIKEQLLQDHKLDDIIEIDLSDGTKKKVTVASVIEKLDSQNNLMEKIGGMEDGNFVSEDEGTVTMDDIANKPEHAKLKNFIMLGKYGLSILKSVGYADGSLTNVESSPRYKPSESPEMQGKDPDLPTMIILSVKGADGVASRYELEFEIDRKYAEPHAAALNGWIIKPGDDYERGEALVLPYPVLRQTVMGFYPEEISEISVKIGVLLVCIGTVSFFSGKYMEGKSKDE